MKTWKKVLGIAGLSLLFASPQRVNAEWKESSEEFVKISDYGLRRELIGLSEDFFKEKYEKLNLQLNEKQSEENKDLSNQADEIHTVYEQKYEELEVKFAKKEEEYYLMYEKLDEQFDNGEITEKQYQGEQEKIEQLFNDLSQKWNEESEKIDNTYSYWAKQDELDNRHEQEVIALEKQRLKELEPMEVYGVISKEAMEHLDYFDTELRTENLSLAGIEYATNLREILGEPIGNATDLRPLMSTTKLETIANMYIDNQINLYALKDLKELKKLTFDALGHINANDEEKSRNSDNLGYTQTLLTDISVLSDLSKLEIISINTKGIMPTVTLKKGTTSYQLYDPIVPSSQFDGAQIEYTSYLGYEWNRQDENSSNSEVKWTGLTGEEEYLSFDFSIVKGKFRYSGQGQIPIRWK